jgi:aspartate/methionine/tyrosine aminotransferase
MFSSRVPASMEPNAMSAAVRAARQGGRRLLDLTLSNPTTAAFHYPAWLLDALDSPEALVYEPSPFGLRRAREAVAQDYSRRGVSMDPPRIVLTSSTSEAYSLVFKLLCEPAGDAVLVPVPSYPLFEHLTRLDGVSPVPYPLEYHRRWTLSTESVEHRWKPETRAVLAVSPNNPTGSCLSASELHALSSLCASRGAALVLDEVFADYPLRGSIANDLFEPACLTFRLGGLSKSAGLPQVKLGWIGIQGPESEVAAAQDRLEFICDAYLSVSTPVQIAAAALIEQGAAVRSQILARVRRNYAHLIERMSAHPSIEVLAAEAGWSAILRVPATVPEESLVIELVEEEGVIVHPGFFFDFPHEAFLIVSLLPPPDDFDEGISRIARVAAAK